MNIDNLAILQDSLGDFKTHKKEEKINRKELEIFLHEGSIIDNGVNVIGGHYCLSDELELLSNSCIPEVESFRWAVELHKELLDKGISSVLILFINDIGLSAEERTHIIGQYKIPDNYLEILRYNNVNPESAVIIFESTLRNRASKEVRKLKKKKSELIEIMSAGDQRLIRCVGNSCSINNSHKEAVTVKGPNGEYLVIKEGPNPKCNTILATLFDQISKNNNNGLTVSCFNSIYIHRLKLGTWVYGLFCKERNCDPMPVVNMFFDEDGICDEY
jgi:hypothetical protein